MSADQNSEPCSQAICTACRKGSVPLTGMDRQIAIQAIAAQAKGSPAEAAYQILAGIEALDHGPEGPLVVLWPRNDFLIGAEERAEWHRAESERLLASAAEFKQRLQAGARKRAAVARAYSDPSTPVAAPATGAWPNDFVPNDRATVWCHMEALAGGRASIEDLRPLSEQERVRLEIGGTLKALLAEGSTDELP